MFVLKRAHDCEALRVLIRVNRVFHLCFRKPTQQIDSAARLRGARRIVNAVDILGRRMANAINDTEAAEHQSIKVSRLDQC